MCASTGKDKSTTFVATGHLWLSALRFQSRKRLSKAPTLLRVPPPPTKVDSSNGRKLVCVHAVMSRVKIELCYK